jgi:hypothetical protein
MTLFLQPVVKTSGTTFKAYLIADRNYELTANNPCELPISKYYR